MKRALIGAIALALTGGAAGAQSDEETFLGDWAGACDNTLVCTAVGFSAEDAGGAAGWIRITRARGAPLPEVVLGAEASDEDPTALSVALTIDGRLVPGVEPVTARRTGQRWRIRLTPEEGGALVGAIRRGGATLALLRGEATLASISLRGAGDLLEYIESAPERPRRAATIVPQRAAADQAGLPRRAPRSVTRVRLDCEASFAASTAVRRVYRLRADLLLWQLPCGTGYNSLDEYVLSDAAGRNARLVRLPGVPRANSGGDIYQPSNTRFDVRTGRLTAMMYGRGLGDCGTVDEWVWTGRAFALALSRSLNQCRGAPDEDWPVYWRAPLARAP